MNKTILISSSLIIVSIILSGSASAIGCGTINNPGSYTFDQNVIVSGTCVTIAVSGVTLTGSAGHKIKYSKYGTGYGVRVNSSLNNVNIINLDIEQVNSSISRSYGIYAPSLASGEIRGNTIKTIDDYGYGIYLSGGGPVQITDNIITTERNMAYGIYLSSSDSHPITGNTITTGSGPPYGGLAHGIYLSSSDSQTITGNTITTEDGTSYGVYFSSSSDSVLTNNDFYTNSYAIYVNPTKTAAHYRHDIGTSNKEDGKDIHYYEPDYNPAPNPIDSLNNIGQLYLANSPGITISNSVGIRDGITIAMSPGVNIMDNAFDVGYQSSISGIFLHSESDDAIIERNTIRARGSLGYGVYLRFVKDSRLRDNAILADAAYAIYVNPTNTASYYEHDIDTSNTEQGKPIHYYVPAYNPVPDVTDFDDIGQLYVANSDGITIDGIVGIRDGITLARTDNSVISGSTIDTGSQAYVSGIYLHSSSNNNDIMGNTITVSGYGAEGINVDSSPTNTIDDNTITASNAYGYGIYLRYSGGSILSDNIISTSGTNAYGIHINSSGNVDVTGNGIDASGSSAYGIYLAGSSDSYLADNIVGTGGNTAHGIFLDISSIDAEISGNTVATSDTNSNGIYLYTSGLGNISDNVVTTFSSNSNGIYLYSSGNSIIGYNGVTTSGADSHGIYLRSSGTNTVTSNTVTTTSGAGSGSRAAYIRDSDTNRFQDNIFDGQGANNIGLYLSDSYDNNIAGGSILGAAYDLSIGNAGSTNNFTDIGLSMGGTVRFRDTASFFNYNKESSGNIWLWTRTSQVAVLQRTIESWNDMLMNWTETGTPSVLGMSYEIRGLIPDHDYAVFKTTYGVTAYMDKYTSDSEGTISFSVTIDGLTTIEVNGDTTPPIVTVINYPDPVVSDGIETFEVTCDDGPFGTGCDKTTISTSHYTCVVDHQASPPETNCTMDLIAECEAKSYTYDVESVDLAHNYNTSVNGTFEVKKADGCNCISSDECFMNSCLGYTVCAESESPEFDLIVTTPENEFETQFEVPLGEEKTILMHLRNPLPISDTIVVEFEGSPPNIENWLDIKIPGSSDGSQSSSMTKTVSVKPHSKISIPISVFAGKTGSYSLTMNARSTTTGQITFNTTIFSIIYAGDDSISTESPGLGPASFILLVFISVMLLQKKNSHD